MKKPKPRGTSAPTPAAKPKANTRPAVLDPHKPHARVDDVAAHFGVSVRTVFTWLTDGCPRYQRGHTLRLRLADVEVFLQTQTQRAASN